MPAFTSQPSVLARLNLSVLPCPFSLVVFACLASVLFFVEPTAVRAEESPDASTSTLGLAPPAGAVVLFDGSNFDAWEPFSFLKINRNDDQKEIQWKLVDGQAMEITFEFEGKPRKQFLCTREKFGDYRLHLEFQLPEEPLSHIILQEHGSPVKFRNIWLVETSESRTGPN